MERDKESKDKAMSRNPQFKSKEDVLKTLADFGKKVLETVEISEEVTTADQASTSEYLSTLKEALNAINQEIKNCTNTEEKLMLYKQRENVMDRMEEEKKNQRHFNENREAENRSHSKAVFAVITSVAVGAGSLVAKSLLENKRT
ncbi:hypothetical protein KQ939_09950 [Planococcus sp. CP5-4]|uniref:hypothetical protein n=1 Tax=unclassified Planococcus (in: firmicutes) TaxID=2662419 RepID=UPI001C21FAB7|nr:MULTISPECIES: hypothetical protein [unclassified Planococcus (in: firmicutes)]MBU9673860.1 hypothetical protein [Planococcus sp. CP5-4_YE]MBV0908988.1 hypothetical protein [Planococcus sp. CP5-4_UN]MBW6064037.1 hypothetical protein [Planococcus sp. CP5-4]